MHLRVYAFLSSIEIHVLKFTSIALSKYECGIGSKIREPFLVSKVESISIYICTIFKCEFSERIFSCLSDIIYCNASENFSISFPQGL